MKTIKTTAAALFTALVYAAMLTMLSNCTFSDARVVKGDGNITTMNYNVTDFQNLDLTGMFSVTLNHGDTPSLVVETDENLQDLIKNKVEDNTLKIFSEKEVVYRPSKMNLYITYKSLEGIKSAGACEILATQPIKGGRFAMELSGAADIKLEVDVEELKTIASGASSLKLSGLARQHTIDMSGAGNIEAANLITQTTKIVLSGAGSAIINASQVLDASLSGIGSIRYVDEPVSKVFNTSGLGSIKKAN
jgi:hypothetical protein